MRTLLRIALACVPIVGIGCADEREYPFRERDPIVSPVTTRDAGRDANTAIIDQGPWKPEWSDAGPSTEPADAGSYDARADARVDAAPSDAAWDAAVDAARDAAVDAAWDAYVDVDAGIPEWAAPTGLQVGPVSFATACGARPLPPSDPTCRAWPWHRPDCFQLPAFCAAQYEDHCTSIDSDGVPTVVGVVTGATCRGTFFPDYFMNVGAGSFDQLGGDVFTTMRGIVKHSLADGSFDTAALSVSALFVQKEQIVVLSPDGLLIRYPSWDDLKADTNAQPFIRYVPDWGTKFGANAERIAAVWPSGMLDIIHPDGLITGIYLQNFAFEDGPPLGVDLDESGLLLFVLTQTGISTYSVQTGELLSRRFAPGMQGLACASAQPLGVPLPPAAASARPGHYYPERDADAILHSDDCAGPFNGPRYYGQTSGPELLVLASYFHQPNVVSDVRTQPHTLVLSSIQSNEWTINVGAGAALERILVNGSPADVKVVSSTPIPIEYHTDQESFGAFNGTWPSPEEAELRKNLESYTGRRVTELLGCHLGSTYTVRDVPPLCGLR